MFKILSLMGLLVASKIALTQTLPPKSYWVETDRYGRNVNTGVVKERYLEDETGNIHGRYISYYANGDKHEVIEYFHGQKEGRLEEFFQGGALKLRCQYQGNVLNGLYFEVQCGYSSCVGIKTTYVKGQIHGSYEKWEVKNMEALLTSSPQNQLVEKGIYVNGVREDQWLERGQKDGTGMKGKYQKGVREGEWINTYINPDLGGFVDYQKEWKVTFEHGTSIKVVDEQGRDPLQRQADILFHNAETSTNPSSAAYIYELFIRTYPQDPRVAQAKLQAQKLNAQGEEQEKAESQAEELQQAKKALQAPELNFNMNSYYLTEESLKSLQRFVKALIQYNQVSSDPIRNLWVLSHTAKGSDNNENPQDLSKDKLYLLSLNRCFMINQLFQKQGLKEVQVHFIPCAYLLNKGKKVEVFWEEQEQVRAGKEVYRQISGQTEYHPTQILLNQALRDGVLYNVKQLAKANVDPELKYRVPIELWMDGYLQYEPKIEEFKKELAKAAGGADQVDQYVYPLNFQR